MINRSGSWFASSVLALTALLALTVPLLGVLARYGPGVDVAWPHIHWFFRPVPVPHLLFITQIAFGLLTALGAAVAAVKIETGRVSAAGWMAVSLMGSLAVILIQGRTIQSDSHSAASATNPAAFWLWHNAMDNALVLMLLSLFVVLLLASVAFLVIYAMLAVNREVALDGRTAPALHASAAMPRVQNMITDYS